MTSVPPRIASLSPIMTDVVLALGVSKLLVGVSGRCVIPDVLASSLSLPRLTEPNLRGDSPELCDDEIDLATLKAAQPTFVLVSPTLETKPASGKKLSTELSARLGNPVQVVCHQPATLQGVYDLFTFVAEALGVGAAGADLAGRMKAQVMDWARSFNDRTRNKRVTFLSGVDPFLLGGRWIPEMIGALSAVSQQKLPGEPARAVSWEEVVQFKPDVIVVAPQDRDLGATCQLLARFEQLPGWEQLPAVKRGEVIFCDGSRHFHRPGPKLVEGMGVLVSAIGGLESGYITPRDSFHRLRWVELHRSSVKGSKGKG